MIRTTTAYFIVAPKFNEREISLLPKMNAWTIDIYRQIIPVMLIINWGFTDRLSDSQLKTKTTLSFVLFITGSSSSRGHKNWQIKVNLSTCILQMDAVWCRGEYNLTQSCYWQGSNRNASWKYPALDGWTIYSFQKSKQTLKWLCESFVDRWTKHSSIILCHMTEIASLPSTDLPSFKICRLRSNVDCYFPHEICQFISL